MSSKFLKFLWALIIFLFIALQVYNLIKANYADVVTSLLTVIIILAMIIVYWLIARKTKSEESRSKPADVPPSNNMNKNSEE
ncbi:MAG: hypothetical protein U9R06_00215 [Patescibacteria group bacterium]|nr:hypothetical protein [Patescibacteria group bacterium]